jgi:hypothetical protein
MWPSVIKRTPCIECDCKKRNKRKRAASGKPIGPRLYTTTTARSTIGPKSLTASHLLQLPFTRVHATRNIVRSRANQAMTSELTPSAAPTNVNKLRAKNPEPTLPSRDPTTQPVSLLWPLKDDTRAWWEEEVGQEYIQQHFSLKHIAKYFRTLSPVSAADIKVEGTRACGAPLHGTVYERPQFRRSRELSRRSPGR